MSQSHPPPRTGPRPSPPGWYPDPLTNGARRRWWTGRDWGDHVSPPVNGPATRPATIRASSAAAPVAHASPTALAPVPRSRSRIRVPWLRLFVAIILGGIAVFAVATGHLPHSLNLLSGEIIFQSATGAAGADRQTVENSQPNIQEQVQEKKTTAENKAKQQPPASTVATLGGIWAGDDGQLSYTISQYGAYVVIVEQSAYGVTAVCYGTVDGDRVDLVFEAIDGSTGTGQLTLTDDDTLTGQFVNPQTEQTGTVTMRR